MPKVYVKLEPVLIDLDRDLFERYQDGDAVAKEEILQLTIDLIDTGDIISIIKE